MTAAGPQHLERIHVGCFSPTGNSRLVAETCGAVWSRELKLPLLSEHWKDPQTLFLPRPPVAAEHLPARRFAARELAVLAFPVYAGRLPNLLLPFIKTLQGDGTPALALVTYGNRSPDDALFELMQLLGRRGFIVLAGAAFVGAHAFSTQLAAGRPDAADLAEIRAFAGSVLERAKKNGWMPVRIDAQPERPPRPYYVPRDAAGRPIDLRKVKPEVSAERCTRCGLCAAVCPTGAIRAADVTQVPGVCIKCGACIKYCPTGARIFTDPGYLYHVKDLEQTCTARAPAEIIF